MSLRLSTVRRSTSRARQQARARSRRRRLWALEGLEDRVLLSGNPTVYTVNLTSDSGASSGTDDYPTAGTPSGDLLWAITQANANTNPDGSVIEFDPTVFATPQTITLSSTLVLSESGGPEVIDGPSAGVVISGNNVVEVFQVDGGVTATLAGLTISGGSATFGGGIDNDGTLTVSDTVISGNSATYGGAIYAAGTVTLSDSTLQGNSAYDGGGIVGAATVVNSTIASNTATDEGGGIWTNGLLTLSGSTIAYNSAYQGGGAFNIGGSVTVCSSTFSDNSATNAGAGIDNDVGTLMIVNSTIADNTAGYDAGGGGIWNGGALTAVNTTIAYNQCSYYEDGGGVYDSSGASTTLDNTIVGVNTRGGSPDDIDGAPVSVVGQNDLVGVDNTGSLTNGTNGNLVIGTANPGLGLLAYNGGPTQTIALLAGSPAVDAGSNALADEYSLTTDQRGAGFPRIVNGVVDIGAYEQPPAASGLATVYTVNLTSDTGASTAPIRATWPMWSARPI